MSIDELMLLTTQTLTLWAGFCTTFFGISIIDMSLSLQFESAQNSNLLCWNADIFWKGHRYQTYSKMSVWLSCSLKLYCNKIFVVKVIWPNQFYWLCDNSSSKNKLCHSFLRCFLILAMCQSCDNRVQVEINLFQ